MRRSARLRAIPIAVLLSLVAFSPGSGAGATAKPTRNLSDLGIGDAAVQDNGTGIYRDPAGGIGACITPDGTLAAGRYRQDGTVYGSAGAWAWEFVVSRAGPAGATWPPKGIRVAGPLAHLRDGGTDAGASIDQAANIVDPHDNFLHAALDHTGKIGRQLAAFARTYPGPWHVRSQLDSDRLLVAGRSYTGTATVIAGNGRRVPVSGLPVSVASTSSSTVRLTSKLTAGGVDRFTITPTRAGRFGTTITVRKLAPATARLTIPVGGRASGYQYLLQAGALQVRSASLSGLARPAGYRLSLEKLSRETGKPLAGAVLAVRDLTTHQDLGDFTTTTGPLQIRDRHTATGGFVDSHRYEVVEVKAPPGYYIPSDHSQVIRPERGRPALIVKLADPTIPHPTIHTQLLPSASSAGQQTMTAGGQISDSIVVSGDDGEDGTITATLEAVKAPASGDCASASFADAAAVTTSAIAINGLDDDGNGTYTTGAVTLNGSGQCATWVESLRLRPSGATATTSPGAPAESVLVTSPSMTTRTSARRSMAGAEIDDEVTVSGTYGQRVRVSGSLLGPVEPVNRSCRTARWEQAPAAETIRSTTFTGNGTHRLGTDKLPAGKGGCYTFVETLTAITNVGKPIEKHTAPGLVSETSLVLHPSARTRSERAAEGHTLRDRISVQGLYGTSARLTARLLETTAADGECKAAGWHRARILGSTSARIHGDGVYLTRALGPVGLIHNRSTCASFADTVTVNGRKLLSTRPGIASETSVLRPRLKIVTGLGSSSDTAPWIRRLSLLVLALLALAALAVRVRGSRTMKHR
jgi:hypothetical protein